MAQMTSGDIILDHQIKSHDGWVAKDNFLEETNSKKVCVAKLLT